MNLFRLISVLLCAISLAACESYSAPRHQMRSSHYAPRQAEQYGRVSDIEVLGGESRPSGGGAILGAVLGGVVGHQMGGGRGNDLATGLGVVGGAVAGNQIERRQGRDNEIYRVTVRFDNGRSQQFDYQDIGDLRVGDSVRIDNGQIYRL